jgi:hypothetical protein
LLHERATEEVYERAALYALGSMTQLEARSFEAHLREGCPACRSLVKHFTKITDGLGFAVPDEEVPAYLRDLLSARVEREPKPPLPSAEPKAKPGEADSRPAPPVPRQPITAAAFRRPPLLPWALLFIAATAAAFFYLNWKNAESRVISATVAEKAKTSAAVAEAEKARAAVHLIQDKPPEPDNFLSTLAGGNFHASALRSPQAGVEASLALFTDTEKRQWILIGQLPPPLEGKDYQVWLMTGKEKISGGLLEPSSIGPYFKIVPFPAANSGVTSVVVTMERKGGSHQPTMRAFLIAKIG